MFATEQSKTRRRRFRAPPWLVGLAFGFALPAETSCVSLEQHMKLQQQVSLLGKELMTLRGSVRLLTDAQKQNNATLNAIVSRAFCPPAINELMRKVKKACQEDKVCKGERVSLSVLSVDPTNRGHFLALTHTQPHYAIYLQNGQQTLTETQRKELRQLLKPPWFAQTHFLVVSHPDPNEGDDMVKGTARGEMIINELKSLKFLNEADVPNYKSPPVPPEKFLHWVFPFTNRNEKLDSKDAPKRSGETLVHSVWVFRVDCEI